MPKIDIPPDVAASCRKFLVEIAAYGEHPMKFPKNDQDELYYRLGFASIMGAVAVKAADQGLPSIREKFSAVMAFLCSISDEEVMQIVNEIRSKTAYDSN